MKVEIEVDETHAAVVAEMRNRTDIDGGDMVDNFSLDATFGEYGGYDPLPLIKAYADRAEAAHKREVETLNSVIQAECASHCAERERLRRAGNAAKLREAVKIAAQSAAEIMERVRHKDGLAFNTANYIIGIANAALAAPARNCDVGTAEEQAERYGRYCDKFTSDRMHCETCPCCGKIPFGRCEFAWAQLSYESEVQNG